MDLEIEEFKDDVEYFNQMKIRASANELPDLMYLQTRYFSVYGDYMLDLSDTQACLLYTSSPSISHEGSTQESPLPQQVQTEAQQPISCLLYTSRCV